MRDDAWFEALFKAHSTAIYRYFLRRGPHEDAQDLTADVLAIAWRRRHDIPEHADLPWLYRTAGFVLANHRRKNRPVLLEHPPQEVDDSDPADLTVADEQVRRVLGRLSARDRRVILLHAWEGLDGEGLAATLGITRGGADAALSRARARLRQSWAEDALDDDDGEDGAAAARDTLPRRADLRTTASPSPRGTQAR